MCMNNLPRVAFDTAAAGIWARKLLMASQNPNHSATDLHMNNDLLISAGMSQIVFRFVCLLYTVYLYWLQFAMEDIEGHTIAEWSGKYLQNSVQILMLLETELMK